MDKRYLFYAESLNNLVMVYDGKRMPRKLLRSYGGHHQTDFDDQVRMKFSIGDIHHADNHIEIERTDLLDIDDFVTFTLGYHEIDEAIEMTWGDMFAMLLGEISRDMVIENHINSKQE